MKITKDTEAKFKYKGNTYRVIDITWAKDKTQDIDPSVVYEDDNGENQHMHSRLGDLVIGE